MNPFSTANLINGKISFSFDQSCQQADVLSRCDQARWVGQIVGPHGSGKSTLAHWLFDHQNQFDVCVRITVRGRRPNQIKQHVNLARPSAEAGDGPISQQRSDGGGGALFVVDGIERLGWLHRKLLINGIRRGRFKTDTAGLNPTTASGLLLTTHRAILGMPVLYQTNFTFEILQRIVSRMAANTDSRQITDLLLSDRFQAQMRDAFNATPTNGREVLMRLYDEFSTMSRSAGMAT